MHRSSPWSRTNCLARIYRTRFEDCIPGMMSAIRNFARLTVNDIVLPFLSTSCWEDGRIEYLKVRRRCTVGVRLTPETPFVFNDSSRIDTSANKSSVQTLPGSPVREAALLSQLISISMSLGLTSFIGITAGSASVVIYARNGASPSPFSFDSVLEYHFFIQLSSQSNPTQLLTSQLQGPL